MTRPEQYALASIPHGPVRFTGLQAPHVSSRCTRNCHEPGAPCRELLQVPALTVGAAEMLHRVADGLEVARVESYEWMRKRWGRR